MFAIKYSINVDQCFENENFRRSERERERKSGSEERRGREIVKEGGEKSMNVADIIFLPCII